MMLCDARLAKAVFLCAPFAVRIWTLHDRGRHRFRVQTGEDAQAEAGGVCC